MEHGCPDDTGADMGKRISISFALQWEYSKFIAVFGHHDDEDGGGMAWNCKHWLNFIPRTSMFKTD